MKIYKILFSVFLGLCFSFLACSSDDNDHGSDTGNESGTFAKGADISWITEMEASGKKFYNKNGTSTEVIRLLKSYGINSVRLRVWVDPVTGWNNKEDMLVKAIRAHNLGMRIMVDFHYSDWWADPGSQTIPAAWQNMDLEQMKQAVANHTTETLNLLKSNGITAEWVQIGNETGNGMLWPIGQADKSMANYAALNNAGYDAVKSVFPSAKVIVHLQSGDNNSLFRWLFDGLQANGGKWDVIGMSLYPAVDTWKDMNESCLANMQDMIERYGSEVMICEVGMSWDEAETCKEFLTDLMAKNRSLLNEKGLGVFYWEPQAYGGWNGYTLGAFDDSGKPTIALDAFR